MRIVVVARLTYSNASTSKDTPATPSIQHQAASGTVAIASRYASDGSPSSLPSRICCGLSDEMRWKSRVRLATSLRMDAAVALPAMMAEIKN